MDEYECPNCENWFTLAQDGGTEIGGYAFCDDCAFNNTSEELLAAVDN